MAARAKNILYWKGYGVYPGGALIYNLTKSNKSVAVLDFGADKTTTSSFTVVMPTNSSTTSLIRLP